MPHLGAAVCENALRYALECTFQNVYYISGKSKKLDASSMYKESAQIMTESSAHQKKKRLNIKQSSFCIYKATYLGK